MTHEFTKTQLQELFLTVDEDKDGKINVDGLATLLKKLGKQDTYKPKLIRDIKLANLDKGTEEIDVHLDFETFLDYYEHLSSALKKTLWKYQKQFLATRKQLSMELKDRDLKTIRDREMRGRIKVIVGEKNQEYSSSIKISLRKDSKKKIIPPSVTITITSSDPQALSVIIDKNFKTVIQMFVSDQPQFQEDLKTVQLFQKIAGDKLIITLTSTFDELLDYVDCFSNFFDALFHIPVDGTIKASFKTNTSFQDLLEQGNPVWIFDLFTRDMEAQLQWDTGEFISAAKQLIKSSEILSDLEYDRVDIPCLTIISLINSEMLSGQFQFNNTKVPTEQNFVITQSLQMKAQFLNTIIEGLGLIFSPDMDDMKIPEIMTLIGEKIDISINFGTIDGDIKLNLKNLQKTLFKYKDMGQKMTKEGIVDDY